VTPGVGQTTSTLGDVRINGTIHADGNLVMGASDVNNLGTISANGSVDLTGTVSVHNNAVVSISTTTDDSNGLITAYGYTVSNGVILSGTTLHIQGFTVTNDGS